MTKDDLIKANLLKDEIDELEEFIGKAEKVWQGKLVEQKEIIKQKTRFIFKSTPYGCIDEAVFNLDTELKNKVLDVLRERLEDLKKQLADI